MRMSKLNTRKLRRRLGVGKDLWWQTLVGAGVVLAAVAAAYVLHPKHGPARRARLKARAADARVRLATGAEQAGERAGALLQRVRGRHVQAPWQDTQPQEWHSDGLYEDTQASRPSLRDRLAATQAQPHTLERPRPDPLARARAQLMVRVCAQLPLLVGHAKAVHVNVADGGRVYLKGHVREGEVERLVAGVQALEGVREVVPDLVVHARPEEVLDLQHEPVPTHAGMPNVLH